MRFDQRYEQILRASASTFAEKGFDGASIRDLSRATRLSLAGLYYYFDSKDALLFQIQQLGYRNLLARLDRRLAGSGSPEEQLRVFIANHLRSFADNAPLMTVLAREPETLKGAYAHKIALLQARYRDRLVEILKALERAGRLRSIPIEAAARGLLGMLNSIHLWFPLPADGRLGPVARAISEIFLGGVVKPGAAPRPVRSPAPAARRPLRRDR